MSRRSALLLTGCADVPVRFGRHPPTGCADVPVGFPGKTARGASLAPLLATVLLLGTAIALPAAESERTGLGNEATPQELQAAGYTVFPDGKGLPEGRGTVTEGKAVYQQFCAACHGRNAGGEDAAALVGGRDSLTSERPRKTVESYWPYATTLWDYVRRSMPYEAPGSLTDDEIYAVVAHLLNLMGLVDEDAALDQESLPKVEMPNRNGFVPDDRPDTDG